MVVLGCQHGAFLESKIDQNATCEFLMFIDVLLVFNTFLRLGGSYVGSVAVLFSHRFLHRFLVVFWIDFGAILGGFWESKSVIFGIDFGHRFLIVFWSDLEVILGGFGEALGGPNRSFLALIF